MKGGLSATEVFIGCTLGGSALGVLSQALAVTGLALLPEYHGWWLWWLHGPGLRLMLAGIVFCVGGFVVGAVAGFIRGRNA